MTIKNILETARTFICQEKRFCKGSVAVDKTGKPTSLKEAERFSLAGAIHYAWMHWSTNPADLKAAELAFKRIVKRGNVQVYSDRFTYPTIMRNLNRAIDSLE